MKPKVTKLVDFVLNLRLTARKTAFVGEKRFNFAFLMLTCLTGRKPKKGKLNNLNKKTVQLRVNSKFKSFWPPHSFASFSLNFRLF